MKQAIKALFALLLMLLAISGTLAAEKKMNKPEIKTVDNYVAIFDFEVRTGDKGISRALADSVRREIVIFSKYEVYRPQHFEATGLWIMAGVSKQRFADSLRVHQK